MKPEMGGRVTLLLHLSKLRHLSWQETSDLLQAALVLALARRKLGRLDPGQFKNEARALQTQTLDQQASEHIARVAWATPRAARIVPWRADCLVQAEAARIWLKRYGLGSEIQLGASKSADGELDAHAWLVCDGLVVTGGDITRFVPFK